jgi:hypothetical protein
MFRHWHLAGVGNHDEDTRADVTLVPVKNTRKLIILDNKQLRIDRLLIGTASLACFGWVITNYVKNHHFWQPNVSKVKGNSNNSKRSVPRKNPLKNENNCWNKKPFTQRQAVAKFQDYIHFCNDTEN